MIKVADLKGLSGCVVELLECDDGKYQVRKTSASISYNERLKAQLRKQRDFQNGIIKVPRVYDEGVDSNGNFYFVMEYISGVTFAEYINLFSFADSIKYFHHILNSIIESELISDRVLFRSEALSKINDLKNKIPEHVGWLTYLENNIPVNIPHARTHGDLTFENIIISHNGEIYYIDFLDSFIDSPYIDLGKLSQELCMYWSVRKANAHNLLLIKYNKLLKHFNIFCEERNLEEALSFFSVLTLLRILPYTNNVSEINLINNCLNAWKIKLL